MMMGALAGLALGLLLYFFEYSSISRAQKERAQRRRVKSVDMDQSERARLRNLGWFCVLLPFAGAGAGWLLG
jgi:hypothetical protein